MHVLLTNDDGILSPGLAALYEAVADLGRVDVVAPETPQSAAAHSITLTSPLITRRVHVQDSFEGTSVDGRPADCVKLALISLLGRRPDVVLSGINAGTNTGLDVLYSGTVAAAAEAALFGLPAVAFSQDMTTDLDFSHSGRIVRRVLDGLLAEPLPRGIVLNVNLPEPRAGWPVGVKLVPQSTRVPEDRYERRVDPRGRTYYWIARPAVDAGEPGESDVSALAEGFVTITPLQFDLTDRARLRALADRPWPALAG